MPSQVLRAIGRLSNVANRFVPRIRRREFTQEKIRVAEDRGEQIVEVMGYSAGQPADAFHLLRVQQLPLQADPLGFRVLPLADVPHDRKNRLHALAVACRMFEPAQTHFRRKLGAVLFPAHPLEILSHPLGSHPDVLHGTILREASAADVRNVRSQQFRARETKASDHHFINVQYASFQIMYENQVRRSVMDGLQVLLRFKQGVLILLPFGDVLQGLHGSDDISLGIPDRCGHETQPSSHERDVIGCLIGLRRNPGLLGLAGVPDRNSVLFSIHQQVAKAGPGLVVECLPVKVRTDDILFLNSRDFLQGSVPLHHFMVPVDDELRDRRPVNDGLEFLLAVAQRLLRLLALADIGLRLSGRRHIPENNHDDQTPLAVRHAAAKTDGDV